MLAVFECGDPHDRPTDQPGVELATSLVAVDRFASAKIRAILKSVEIPLTPRMPRAIASDSRIHALPEALAIAACSERRAPLCCSWLIRTIVPREAVVFSRMLTSFSCTSWNDAICLPSWHR